MDKPSVKELQNTIANIKKIILNQIIILVMNTIYIILNKLMRISGGYLHILQKQNPILQK